MNALVVYESQFGNTEKVAMAVAGALRAFGQAQAVRVDPAHPIELQGVDMLVVGGPTQSEEQPQAYGPFSPRSRPNFCVTCGWLALIPACANPAGWSVRLRE